MRYGDMATLAEKLARLIGNQSEMERKTGIAQSAISKMTKGERRPYADQLGAIARALGVSADYLLNDDLDEPPRGNDLSPGELSVLKMFRHLGISTEEAVEAMVGRRVLRSQAPTPTEEPSHPHPRRRKAR